MTSHLHLRWPLCAALAVAIAVAAGAAHAAEEPPLTGAEAKQHVGEDRTVCGQVASARYLDASATRPTFLNFDKPYPDHTFTVVIFGTDRAKFGEPEKTYRRQSICASGRIEEFKGQPQIVVRDPAQVTVQRTEP
jgi:DNA/RNA endonuclease YhcR with UshA esterase domain